MKKRTVWCFLSLLLLSTISFSAVLPEKKVINLDSLKHLLRTAVHDTTRLKVRYAIAMETARYDLPVWENMRVSTKLHHLTKYETGSLMMIAEIYRKRNDPQKMADMYYRAFLLAQEHGHKKEMIELCERLQAHYSERFDAKRTLYFLYKGLKVAEELNSKEDLVDLYTFLSVFYISSGDNEKALGILQQCLKKCRAMNYGFGIAGALLDIGTIYSKIGREDITVAYYLESLHYVESVEGTIYAVQVYTSVSDAYRYKKQYDSASYFIDKAHRLAWRLNDYRSVASTLAVKGFLATDQGKYAEAEQFAFEGLKIARQIQFTMQIPAFYLLQEKLYSGMGNYRKALIAYKAHVRLRDSVSNEATRKQSAEKEFAFNLGKKESQYKLLAQQSQIKDLRLRENEIVLRQNRYIATGSVLALLVLLSVVFLLIRQSKFRTEHQRVLLEQKLLRAQMNPHFVFNSLNSIQGFVMEKQTGPAELYLSKFASLLRDLLESNINDSLSVADEIGILTAYLEMEELRFGTSFVCSVYVDERIDKHKTQIPHLMIQPFVENAIWHGLLPKAGPQELSVRFEYHTKNTLRCVVDDNGVGREASAGSATTFRKKSLALSFVQQRMELIRKVYKIEGGVTITDKKDPEQNSLGTTVIIIVPILNA